jgi:hypothetical protein
MKEVDSEIYLNILSIDLFNSLPENYKSRIYIRWLSCMGAVDMDP